MDQPQEADTPRGRVPSGADLGETERDSTSRCVVQLAEQPEGLFAHLGKRLRRKGDRTADQDRQLILQFWRHLIDPAKWPVKDITVDEGRRRGRARGAPLRSRALPDGSRPIRWLLLLDIYLRFNGNRSSIPTTINPSSITVVRS